MLEEENKDKSNKKKYQFYFNAMKNKVTSIKLCNIQPLLYHNSEIGPCNCVQYVSRRLGLKFQVNCPKTKGDTAFLRKATWVKLVLSKLAIKFQQHIMIVYDLLEKNTRNSYFWRVFNEKLLFP